MTPLLGAVQAVRDFAEQSITSYEAFPQSDAQFFEAACFKDLLAQAHKASPAERNEVLAALAPLIVSTRDIFQASRLAMLCGVLVEWGADPTIAISAILARLPAQLTLAAPLSEGGDERGWFAQAPDAVKAWKGLRYMIMPAMTMLSLDGNARQSARRNAALVNAISSLAPKHRETNFLDRLFNLTDGEELLVLHPHENQGFRVRLEAIASNFHLFSLLQDALVGDGKLPGPHPNRKVIATAKGEIPHDRIITDAAVWHYANWTALQSDGTLAAAPIDTWVLGEATPRDIPQFEGERLVLLGPPVLNARGWDSSFFTNLHDALRSKVEVIEVLSADEIALRLKRIGKAIEHLVR
ncbi:MAG: hypothetical protein HY289_11080 [Planctomycetes bacterium]|nr:hypothetical protein [Planctomycetota bacterium]